MMKRLKHAGQQIWIAVDQLGNVILLNPFSFETWADETISCRCGRLGHRYPYKFWKVVVIDPFFQHILRQGPNHCVNAYHKEMQRYNFPPIMRNPDGNQTL